MSMLSTLVLCASRSLTVVLYRSVIRMVTDDEHVNYPILVVFLDQFIAILKVLSENVHNLAEDLRVIDIPSTLYTLATFISRVEDTELASVRLKVKFCTLCNSVFSRTEPVIMRNKESSMRQSIADIIVDWVQETPAVGCCIHFVSEHVLMVLHPTGGGIAERSNGAQHRSVQGCSHTV